MKFKFRKTVFHHHPPTNEDTHTHHPSFHLSFTVHLLVTNRRPPLVSLSLASHEIFNELLPPRVPSIWRRLWVDGTPATIRAWSTYKVFPEAPSIRNQTSTGFLSRKRGRGMYCLVLKWLMLSWPYIRGICCCLLNPSTTFVTVAPSSSN